MKLFDFCIGNPPYNAEFGGTGDNAAFAQPVYDKFYDAVNTIADKVELITPARFLFNAGSTPKAWNEKMLGDPHFKVLHYEEDAAKVFPSTIIKGGVAITYYDNKKDFGAIEVFTKYPELNQIMKKVNVHTPEDSLTSIIYIQNKFNLEALYQDYPQYKSIIGSDGKDKRFRNNIFDKIAEFKEEPSEKDDVAVYGVIKNKRSWRYIKRKYVDDSHENLDKWKTLVVRVNGTGALGEVLSTPLIEEPGKGYTQTFIGIGSYDSREEAENTLKYVKTKFARTMLSILKVTQDNNRDVWKYVPLQDFSSSSDIDWSESIHDIDLQLYRKYKLSKEEIDFIETNVKEMV